jgi:hypothetical protein
MIKKWTFYTSIAIIVAFISSSFQTLENRKPTWFFTTKNEINLYLFPALEATDYTHLNTPFSGKSFTGFKEAIAFRESQGKFKIINSLGYMGKYQFGRTTLNTIGISNTAAFLNNPNLQEKAFVALLSINKSELQSEIEKFDGTVVSGIQITESGILAAAHLGGAGSVKKFFKSKGTRANRDGFGTSIKSYLRKFSGYDTSVIIADSTAKI